MPVPDPIIARLVDFREGVKRRNLNPFEYSPKALLGGENVELQLPALTTRKGIKPLGADAAGSQELLAFDFDDAASPPGTLNVAATISDGTNTGTVNDPNGRLAAGNAVLEWDADGLYVAANHTNNDEAVWIEFPASDNWYLDDDFTLTFDFRDLECNHANGGYDDYGSQGVILIGGPGWILQYSQAQSGCNCEDETLTLKIIDDDWVDPGEDSAWSSPSWSMEHVSINAFWQWEDGEWKFNAHEAGSVYVRVIISRTGNNWTISTGPIDADGNYTETPTTTTQNHASTFTTVDSAALVLGKAYTVYWEAGCPPAGMDPLDAGLYIANVTFEKESSLTTTVSDGTIPALKHVRFPSSEATYLLFQTQDQSSNANALWCVTDQLPVSGSAPTYTSLYDLGTSANVVDIAVLNDRCVITEGANKAPLVWLGCQESDGSDWAKPLLVLVSPDGVSHYDVSRAVLDTDSDNYAAIGDLNQAGYIAICCDVPWVSGFRFEFDTPNAGGTSSSTVTLVADVSGTNLERHDRKNTIERWVQDSGATGHFEAELQNLDAGDAVQLNTVNLPSTGHPFAAGDSITVSGSTSYDATYTLPTQTNGTANAIEVKANYTAETFAGTETVTGQAQNLDAAAAVDNGGSPNTVNIPCTGHGYSAGDVVVIAGTSNYDATYTLPTQTNGDANNIEIQSAYSAETFDGSETVSIQVTLDNAAAVNNAQGTVTVPCTAHGYAAGDVVEIRNTANYDGTYTLPAQTAGDADNIVLTSSYTAETFSSSDTVAQRCTLGSSNDCPLVAAGLLVTLASGTNVTISSISGDGEASGEVTVSSAVGSEEVSGIYGLQITSSSAHPAVGDTAMQTVYTKSIANETDDGGDTTGPKAGYSYRVVIPASGGGVIASSFQAKIRCNHLRTWQQQCEDTDSPDNVGGLFSGSQRCTQVLAAEGYGGVNFDRMAVGTRSSGANTADTPVEIGYQGSSGLQSDDESESIWLDETGFEWDASADHVLIFDLGSARSITGDDGVVYKGPCVAKKSSGTNYYKAATDSYDQSSVSGFTTGSDAVIVEQVRVRASTPATTDYHVGILSVNLAGASELKSVDVQQAIYGSSVAYHCVSFDGGSNWKIYSSGWVTIAKLDGSTWKFKNGASYTAADVNTKYRAIEQAMTVSANRWTKTQVEATTQNNWESTGGFVADDTTEMELAFVLKAAATRNCYVFGYRVEVTGSGITQIERWSDGAWSAQTWTDGTESGGAPFAQNGNVSYNDTGNYSDSDYGTVDGQPGYWWRIRFAYGLSANTTLTKVKFKAPMQPLRNIGSRSLETPLGFLVEDSSEGNVADYTTEVSDYTQPSYAKIYYDNPSGSDEALGSSDAIYVGYDASPFVEVDITVAPWGSNLNTATLGVWYWNGTRWAALTTTDGTKTSGCTLRQDGRIRWSVPSDWKIGRTTKNLYVGYWIKLIPSENLSTTTKISEVRVLPQPAALVKYDHCAVLRDRLVLGRRSDAPDQVDVSRALEEYGFSGSDSYSLRVGGEDGIAGLVTAWNNVLIAKPSDAALLSESSGVSASRLEVGHTPINPRVVVRAPMGGISEQGNVSQQGLFFINTEGAFVYSGLQADQSFGTARSQYLSSDVDWWDEDATYRIDTDNLYIACGTYWPEKHWVIWSVPMLTSGTGSQTTNNRLIVFDLALRAWLPPMTATLASLATAYHYKATAPGKLGKQGLYGGGYDGRIYRLFAFDDDFDVGTTADDEVAAYAETGWLDFGDSTWFKQLRSMTVFANAEGTDGDITVKVYVDGLTTQDSMSPTFSQCASLSGREAFFDYTKINIQGRWFKFRLDFTGPTRIYAVVAELGFVRRWPSGEPVS